MKRTLALLALAAATALPAQADTCTPGYGCTDNRTLGIAQQFLNLFDRQADRRAAQDQVDQQNALQQQWLDLERQRIDLERQQLQPVAQPQPHLIAVDPTFAKIAWGDPVNTAVGKLQGQGFTFVQNIGPDAVYQNQGVLAALVLDHQRQAVGLVILARMAPPNDRLLYDGLRESYVAKFGDPTSEGYTV